MKVDVPTLHDFYLSRTCGGHSRCCVPVLCHAEEGRAQGVDLQGVFCEQTPYICLATSCVHHTYA